MALPWVLEQCRQKLGFTPYPGTLNLQVIEADMAAWEGLKRDRGIILQPPDGFCEASCYPADVEGLPAAVLLPRVAGYPVDKLEIVAPLQLTARLGLALGQELTVTILSA